MAQRPPQTSALDLFCSKFSAVDLFCSKFSHIVGFTTSPKAVGNSQNIDVISQNWTYLSHLFNFARFRVHSIVTLLMKFQSTGKTTLNSTVIISQQGGCFQISTSLLCSICVLFLERMLYSAMGACCIVFMDIRSIGFSLCCFGSLWNLLNCLMNV